MEILAAKIFIEAAILCGLLRLVAKHEADYNGKTYLWELQGAKGKKLDLKQLRTR